ncbi:hypothetical protein DAERI_080082 [Deinococcus aerius]|uniref:Uncharacterized protein n=1 Tax=Deinococcus aerius TaxID=200253 RepID=A0A2I9DMQ2_9DEIO|nr:hypothetical protein [Deinococcus aerius]GBF06291.1 hypothetical protein DAERI_080082 [Deinococcus aerius]
MRPIPNEHDLPRQPSPGPRVAPAAVHQPGGHTLRYVGRAATFLLAAEVSLLQARLGATIAACRGWRTGGASSG